MTVPGATSPLPRMQRVSDVLRDPSLLTATAGGVLASAAPATLPIVGEDLLARLRADVVRCCGADRSYSPASDMAKALSGEPSRARVFRTLLLLLLVLRVLLALWARSGSNSPPAHRLPQAWSTRRRCTRRLTKQEWRTGARSSCVAGGCTRHQMRCYR